MIASITAFLSANPWISVLASAAFAWLMRHYGIGSSILPALGGSSTPPKPQGESSSPILDRIRSVINSELQSFRPQSGSTPAPAADAVHTIAQMLIDHPDQAEALLKVVGALAAKAAKSP